MKDKIRCQALDMDLKQCKRRATRVKTYVGDPEIYDNVKLVKIYLCKDHKYKVI